MSKMSNLAIDKQNEVVDLYKEHRFHNRYEPKCSECFALDKFWSTINSDDEEKLQEAFMEEAEVNGMGITKDNDESLFDIWSENLSMQEIRDILKTCPVCKGKGYIEYTEWSGTDDSYEITVPCECQED